MVAYALASGVHGWQLALLVVVSLIPLSEPGLALTNRIAADTYSPELLPKLDPFEPVLEEHRTLVVVPSLMLSVRDIKGVIDNLEVAYLANRDQNVGFALLGDPTLSPSEELEDDEFVLEAAIRGIDELNDRYRAEYGVAPFHFFGRRRVWSDGEDAWMGWERKRGFLVELVRELRGNRDTTVNVRIGDDQWRRGVVFVLTLDADTVLPRDAAKRLICTIAHPLNRTPWKPGQPRVYDGYGLIQPRVGMSLPGANRSAFAKLYSTGTGVDPYAMAVSDTYQDLFGEGSFTGKGIFEVDVFAGVLEKRFRANSLLSHDLVEGAFLRTGLASDVEVIDDYPANYLASMKRMHRWVRGDWQTIVWLFPRVRDEDGLLRKNPLSALNRWKIFDNLRRSLVGPLTMVLFTLGWLLFPSPALGWTLFFLLTVFFPVYFSLAQSLMFQPPAATLSTSARGILSDLLSDSRRGVIALLLLPHEAWVVSDAILRTLWRMLVSRKHLMEWVTAAEAERGSSNDTSTFWRAVGPGSAAGIALMVVGAVPEPVRLAAAAPFVLGWAIAPLVAWRVSQPLDSRADRALTEKQRKDLRRVSRKTWRFFDTFVTHEGHHLAPDNFQEEPLGVVAWRTSPTNMGLQLLSYLNAYDLGYLSLAGLAERVSATLTAMAALERYHGHFYNWYDITTRQPLRPTYVSTVDSGNLAGHLLTLRVGLLEASEAPVIGSQLISGARDATTLALEDLLADREDVGSPALVKDIRTALDAFARALDHAEPPANLGEWHSLLTRLEVNVSEIDLLAYSLDTITPAEVSDEVAPWPKTRREQLRASLDDVVASIREPLRMLEESAPWAEFLPDAPPGARGDSRIAPLLRYCPSLVGLAEGLDRALTALDELTETAEDQRTRLWASGVAAGIREARDRNIQLLAGVRLAADIAREMWEHTDFTMLYDEQRGLFSIGYNLNEGRLDPSFYDLLASEARLASFLAVAKGDVPQEHWFRLGRSLTDAGPGRALVSWSGSMFEYLMPLLVMHSLPGTLLDETYGTVVERQRLYGADRGVPWGVSEAAFNAKDADLTYQYQAFGVPGLGLKRGLADDIVVAPYACALALSVDPQSVLPNLSTFSAQGGEGRYGYYESMDFTAGRVPAGQRRAVVQAYFAHHQGMAFVAFGNALLDDKMRNRFHSDPIVASAELLLQERIPRHVELVTPHSDEVELVRSVGELPPPAVRLYPSSNTPVPATHFLSNGRYSVMVTSAGGGYSRWRGISVTRYREDVTRDLWGTFFYLRDTESGHTFSVPANPWPKEPDEYQVSFGPDKAEFRRLDGDLETNVEVVVSPEDDVEIRRITVSNRAFRPRSVEITSYFEIALTGQGSDQAHRAFSNLFVETEALPATGAVLFTRRPRSNEEEQFWGFHLLSCEQMPCDWTFETDRAKFLGRLHAADRPVAVSRGGKLSNTSGAVLDPCCAIRRSIEIGPGEAVRLVYVTGVANERDTAVRLTEKYFAPASAQRAVDLAWTAAQVELRDLGITPQDALTLERLASRLLLTDPYSPLKVKTPVENELPVSGLWSVGISGDYPILLVRVQELEHTPLVRRALLAHQYWRHKGLMADLVVLNTRPTGYADELEERLRLLMRTGHGLQVLDKPGGVFLRRGDQMHPDVMNLLVSTARAVVDGEMGTLELQLNRRSKRPGSPSAFVPRAEPVLDEAPEFVRPKLLFDNGTGGFDPDTGDYVIVLDDAITTPTPWVNVIANPEFGCLVSEAGIGCSWALNSHENRITTWNNDPVSDGSGECLYLRDEETGRFWSPTPLPCRTSLPYVVRHAPGCTTFDHADHGIRSQVEWFVPADDQVRIVRLKLTNLTDRPREISVTHFIEWTLGSSRSAAQQRVVTRFDGVAEALTARNWFNPDFPGRPAYVASSRPLHSWTASRTEFVGRNGRPGDPAAMHRSGLGGVSGRFHDNCGALMNTLSLEPGATEEVSFFLGQCNSPEEIELALRRYRAPGAIDAALDGARNRWDEILSAVSIETPDPALDLLVNRWLPYQNLSCRVWGRTATYQSSGALGFRDQLQDSVAALVAMPEVARAQILEASRRQFVEGDVLHWWQPFSGRGVRTHFVDDRLWLPYALVEYLRATGDTSILDERTSFIEGPALPPDQEDLYLQPIVSESAATVYEHCVRAIERNRSVGAHGLPLMGGGDWNDGMNRVGHGGKGESVWMAWFLGTVLTRFAPICETRGDADRAAEYRRWAQRLGEAAEANAWDGAWYRRAYFDDGVPLGSRESEECRIDAIAQAWATISGLGVPEHAEMALDSVDENLVRSDVGILTLLTPPFDRMTHDPGYIKGYVPGVRENGGQYTHAAVWVILAYLLRGDGDQAHQLLEMVNPINHALDKEQVRRYAVEPYAVAGDVYAAEQHLGRGGWTWYTGAAGWMYQVAVRWLLGVWIESRDGVDHLVVEPCVPKSWSEFAITVRRGSSTYRVSVENPRGANRGVTRVALDGTNVPGLAVPLVDDGAEHSVVVTMIGG